MQKENAIATCPKKRQPTTTTGRTRSQSTSFAAVFLRIIFGLTILQQSLGLPTKACFFMCMRENETSEFLACKKFHYGWGRRSPGGDRKTPCSRPQAQNPCPCKHAIKKFQAFRDRTLCQRAEPSSQAESISFCMANYFFDKPFPPFSNLQKWRTMKSKKNAHAAFFCIFKTVSAFRTRRRVSAWSFARRPLPGT